MSSPKVKTKPKNYKESSSNEFTKKNDHEKNGKSYVKKDGQKKYPPKKKMSPEESAKQCKEDMLFFVEKIQKVLTDKCTEIGLDVKTYYADQSKLDKGNASIDIVLTLVDNNSSEKNLTICITREQMMKNYNLIIIGGNVGRRKFLFSSYGNKETTEKKVDRYIPSVLDSTKVILEKITKTKKESK